MDGQLLSLALLLVAAAATAQEAPATFEFSFSNPGARSMGFGGAFVALADDATAAFANPAGLVQLLRPEVSLEIRQWRFSTPYTAGGRASGAPTGNGIDVEPGIRTAVDHHDTADLSFLSAVYPAGRFSLALYHHQLTTFRVGLEINGLFGAGDPPDGVIRYPDQRTSTEMDIVSTGLAAAFRVNEALSLGVGLSFFEGSVGFTGNVYLRDSSPATFFDPNSFLPERRYISSRFDADATDWGFNAGLLWSVAKQWTLGGVYRQGPELPYVLENRAGPAHELPEGTVLDRLVGFAIEFPDVYGLGVAYRTPGGSLTVGFEWDRVEYSSIVESLDSPLADISAVSLDDVDELHLGLEYVMLDSTPLLAFRAAGWLDPDHRIRYEGDDQFARALFPPGEDAIHLALGVGMVFQRIQLDLGVDLSKFVDTASLSVIYHF